MKKMMCVFLAIVMCMALALPAFAGDAGDTPASGTTYTGQVKTPDIKVTAPTAQNIMLNPYKIKIAANSIVSGGTGDIAPSVITPTLVLVNESDVPLKMTLTVTGEIPNGSTAKFLTDKPAETEKNHGVFLYVDVLNKGSLGTAPAVTQVISGVTEYATSNVYSAENPDGTQCVVKAGAVKMTDFTTLAVPASGQKGYVTIDIGGECATTPTTAWASTDTVNVTFAFTFTATNNTGS